MALDQQPPFLNPSVPFCSPIQRGWSGLSITVCGRVLPDTTRFQVDLQHGSDIILHFNPRYDEGSGKVVHNTYQNGKWESEEIKYETPFPRDQRFALQILVTLGSYKISTNGKPFSEFKHRVPFSHVDSICIGGMVELSLVAFQPLYAAPPGCFVVPYKSIIEGGVRPGKIIIIQGDVKPEASRMEIILRHTTGIAFYDSVRFDEHVVVYNSCEDGTWGNEERSELMPFKRGEPMQVTIFCSRDHYEVFVNGQLTHTYNYRYTKLEEIDVLDISGDVQLTFVQS